MAAGTAVVRYELDVSTVGWSPVVDILANAPTDPPVTGVARTAWSLVGRAVKAGDRAISRGATGVSEGVVDFHRGECLCRRAAREWCCRAPAR